MSKKGEYLSGIPLKTLKRALRVSSVDRPFFMVSGLTQPTGNSDGRSANQPFNNEEPVIS